MGTPISSNLMGFPLNHPFLGTPILGTPHIFEHDFTRTKYMIPWDFTEHYVHFMDIFRKTQWVGKMGSSPTKEMDTNTDFMGFYLAKMVISWDVTKKHCDFMGFHQQKWWVSMVVHEQKNAKKPWNFNVDPVPWPNPGAMGSPAEKAGLPAD